GSAKVGAKEDIVEVKKNMVEVRLRDLQARAIALDTRLVDLKERRDRGRLDDGRYTDLAADIDRERIGLLYQLKAELAALPGASAAALDPIIEGAIRKESDVFLLDQLAKVAENRGLGQTLLDQLKQKSGAIFGWLVDVGLAIARQHGLG